MPNILLGVTGSVAAVLTPKLVDELKKFGDVKIIFTETAYKFVSGHYRYMTIDNEVYNDESEWREFQKIGDKIIHIELRKWADVMVIAPCTMNTLAKIANGLCDNLLTNIVRAWDYDKPLIVAPACNTLMWDSPLTTHHMMFITALGIEIVYPVSKTLACGDTGVGAMSDIPKIVQKVKDEIGIST